MDFGQSIVGDTVEKRWPFENCGDEDLVISETTIGQDPDSVFGVIGTDYDDDKTLAPGERGAVDLSFTATRIAPPSHAGELWIDTNSTSAQPFKVLLLGEGLERPSCELGIFPESVNFGRSTTLAQRELRIFNQGSLDCRVFGAERVAGSVEFELQGTLPSEASPINLAPNDSFTVTVAYLATVGGPADATFEFSADDAYGTDATAQVNVNVNPDIDSEGCVLDIQPTMAISVSSASGISRVKTSRSVISAAATVFRFRSRDSRAPTAISPAQRLSMAHRISDLVTSAAPSPISLASLLAGSWTRMSPSSLSHRLKA